MNSGTSGVIRVPFTPNRPVKKDIVRTISSGTRETRSTGLKSISTRKNSSSFIRYKVIGKENPSKIRVSYYQVVGVSKKRGSWRPKKEGLES